MVKDAESHAEEDRRHKEKVETRNQLDSLVYQVEKDVKEWGDRLDAGAKGRLDDALERARKALKQDDAAELTAARDELMQAFSAAGQQIYQAQSAAQEPAGATGAAEPEPQPSGAAKEDVVEADYEIGEEDKG